MNRFVLQQLGSKSDIWLKDSVKKVYGKSDKTPYFSPCKHSYLERAIPLIIILKIGETSNMKSPSIETKPNSPLNVFFVSPKNDVCTVGRRYDLYN